jgi:chloramphenicol-sensitive protein RarD
VLGVVVLRERLRPAQWLAVTLATLGVMYQILVFGTVPWVALVLALSFAGYGLLRKVTPIEPISGLFIEALLLTPLALGYLLVLGANNSGVFPAANWRLDALLALSGPLTALPLILFVAGARRIRLATVGLLQYITPTGQFLLAVFVYDEAFSRSSLIVFASIWAGLTLYSLDTLWRSAKR